MVRFAGIPPGTSGCHEGTGRGDNGGVTVLASSTLSARALPPVRTYNLGLSPSFTQTGRWAGEAMTPQTSLFSIWPSNHPQERGMPRCGRVSRRAK